MSDRTTIVVFTTPAMGHIKPMLPLIDGLVAEGLTIVCFGHRSFEDIIAATGAEFRAYPDVAYDIDAPDFNLVQMGADLIRASESIFPALKSQVEALSPRLIVQDFMALWASRIGTALAIPRVQTIPTIVFNREAQRRMRREDGLYKLAGDVVRGVPSLIDAMIRSRFAISLHEAFGLDGSWRRLAPPIQELVFFLEALQVGDTKGDVPRAYIGPTRHAHRTFEAVAFEPGYALITFGTLSNNETERFEAAINGAFRAGLSVVAQCGRKVDLAWLDALCRSLEESHPGQKGRILESVPHMEPLVLGAALVIHHAGMATTWEAARFRKPALMIPTICDQKVLASQLEAFGIGVRLETADACDAAAIARALGQVRSLACPWEKLEALLEQAGGANRGVEIILDILAIRGEETASSDARA